MFKKSIYLLSLLVLTVVFSACSGSSHQPASQISDGTTTGATPASLYFKMDFTKAPIETGYVYGSAVDLSADKLKAMDAAVPVSKDRKFDTAVDSAYIVFNSDYSSAKIFLEYATDGEIQKFGDDVPVVNGIMAISKLTIGRLNFTDSKTMQLTPVNYFKVDTTKSNMKTAEFYMDAIVEPSLDFIKAIQDASATFEMDENTELFMVFDPSFSQGEAVAQNPTTNEMMIVAKLDISAQGIVTSKDAKDLKDKLTVAGDYSSATMLHYVAPDRGGIYISQDRGFNFTYMDPSAKGYQDVLSKVTGLFSQNEDGTYHINKALRIEASKYFTEENYEPAALVICDQSCVVNYDSKENKVILLVFVNKNTGEYGFKATFMGVGEDLSVFSVQDYPEGGYYQEFAMTINPAVSATIAWQWMGPLPQCLQPQITGYGNYKNGETANMSADISAAVAANPDCNLVEFFFNSPMSGGGAGVGYTPTDWPYPISGSDTSFSFQARVYSSNKNIKSSDYVVGDVIFSSPAIPKCLAPILSPDGSQVYATDNGATVPITMTIDPNEQNKASCNMIMYTVSDGRSGMYIATDGLSVTGSGPTQNTVTITAFVAVEAGSGFAASDKTQTTITFLAAPIAYDSIGLIQERGPQTDIDLTLVSGVDNWALRVTLPEGNYKFRANHSWTLISWGSTNFPSGVVTAPSPDYISVPEGQYDVTFNSTTGVYNFKIVQEGSK